MRMESLILHYQHLFHQLLLLLIDVFLISLWSSTFSNSSPFAFEINLVFIIKREIQPKNKFKKANLSFIN